jgi:hypothetical protein
LNFFFVQSCDISMSKHRGRDYDNDDDGGIEIKKNIKQGKAEIDFEDPSLIVYYEIEKVSS